MGLRKEDFYSGAFLAYLLNNGIVPALFEERLDKSRRIYDFTTNKGVFRVYVKGSDKPSSKSQSKNSSIWNFQFTEKQVDELKELKSSGRNLYFAYICGKKQLNKSKIAIVPAEIVFQCIDINRSEKYKNQSVRVRLQKGSWNFDIYGTARADKVNGIDNTLKVRVKNMNALISEEVIAK